MHGSLIVRIVVHTLDNVDLAGLRPSRTVRPKCGPSTAARRHVNTIHDDEPAREGILRLNADGIAVARNLRCAVDTQDSISGTID